MEGNFGFLRAEWPGLYAEARHAERDALVDARTACFYARRTIEHAVAWLYLAEAIPEPYKSDLAARLHQPQFVSIVQQRVHQKMNLLRKLGNSAVHDAKPIPIDRGQIALREMFHVLSWIARTYGKAAESRPDPALQFNPALLPKPAGQIIARSAAQIAKLNDELQELDAQLKASEAQNVSLEEQLAQARAELKVAKAANLAVPDTHDYTEDETRSDFIDIDLHEAGWLLDEPRDREFPVDGMPDGKKGFVDYVLWGADGKPLALVEAKRTSRDARAGQHQAKLYADCLEQMYGRRPVIYFSNGDEHHIWDDVHYPPHRVQGFNTRDELELLIQRRASRKELAKLEIPTAIVGRPYQQRAIRRVMERFESENQRQALLVMATGSGKTRTAIALADMLTRANWAKRVLFLADRRALVRQAVNAFRQVLPDSAPVNLVTDKATESRICAATYPTMMGLINQVENGRRRFGPGYFDLVIIDEAHRSVYQKYRHIFEYFDSLLIGLTATPKDEVDRNTYQLFNLENGVPTDHYELNEAINDGYLVPPRAITVPLKFPREGMRYDDLPDEEKLDWDDTEWDEDGSIPSKVEVEAVNKWLFNSDTVDKTLEVLMTQGHKVAGGDRLAKTIIFAKNNAHALFIADRFDTNYPEYNGEFAKVITTAVDYAESLIDDFSQPDKSPHIAISVDMLDTGIDVPEVSNLILFKPIRSKSKFWQMIGRGTRLCPDLFGPGFDKKDFFVFDLCANFEFFNQNLNPPDGKLPVPLSERIFVGRTRLVAGLQRADAHSEVQGDTVDTLVEHVKGMSPDNIIVKPQRRIVEKYSERKSWESLVEQQLAEIIENVAPLPTAVRDPNEAAKRFDLMVIQCQLAVIYDESLEPHRSTIRQIADGLLEQLRIPAVGEREELLREVVEDEWWQDVTVPMLERARRDLRMIVEHLPKKRRRVIYTDFTDSLGDLSEVDIAHVPVGTDVARFNAKVYHFLAHQPDNLALQKVRTAKPLTQADLDSLEGLLLESGVAAPDDLERMRQNAVGLGAFIRSLVGLDRTAATEAFAEFLDGRTASADQIEFINLIIRQLTKHGVMSPKQLFEPPFTDAHTKGVTHFFDKTQSRRIVEVLERINNSTEIA